MGLTGNVGGELWHISVVAHLVHEFHLDDRLVGDLLVVRSGPKIKLAQ